MLDAWFQEQVESFVPNGEPIEWVSTTKAILHRCKEHPQTIYHIFDGLSRDQLERYIFSLTDDPFSRVVRQAAQEYPISEGQCYRIATFCRYAYIGFVMQFFWNHMENDIDESVDKLGVLFDQFLSNAVKTVE